MATVLFGQGYYLRFDPKLWAAQQPYPPLGTLYAAAHLRSQGHDVALFDAMLASSEDEWARALGRHRPRFAVVYEDSFNYLTKMCLLRMREAALTMARMARAQGATVVVSGSDATDHPEVYLDAGADYVVAGEGEATLAALVGALTRGAPVTDLPGLCLRDAAGRLVRTAAREFLRDLDALPWPAWDLVDVARYRGIWHRRHGYHSMNVATTRGCPYHCNWCAKPIYGQRYAVRRPEAVADEVAWLKRNYAPDHLSVVDDIFGLKPGWIERFADALSERDAVVPFKCLSRADLLDDRSVSALRRAGCRTVWIGAESGSQRILDAMEKGTHVDEIRAAARRLHDAGIEVGFFLQFGYPGETLEDIDATRRLVQECAPDDIGISVSYPLPGTKFHERVRAQIGEKRNWTDSQDLAMLYGGPFSTEFYRTLHRVVHKEFRIRHFREGRGGRPWRRTAAFAWNAATLPLDRLRLARLARSPHDGLGPLPVTLRPEEAARPSPPA